MEKVSANHSEIFLEKANELIETKDVEKISKALAVAADIITEEGRKEQRHEINDDTRDRSWGRDRDRDRRGDWDNRERGKENATYCIFDIGIPELAHKGTICWCN